MEDLIKKQQDAGREDALQSEEGLRLDDNALDEVEGGRIAVPARKPRKKKLAAQPAIRTDQTADEIRLIKC